MDKNVAQTWISCFDRATDLEERKAESKREKCL